MIAAGPELGVASCRALVPPEDSGLATACQASLSRRTAQALQVTQRPSWFMQGMQTTGVAMHMAGALAAC